MTEFGSFFRYFCYRPAAVLKVTGEDAFPFLQGQFSQDLRSVCEDDHVVYGLWLNQKGKVLADSSVLHIGSDWLVISLFSAAQTIRERLEAYVIADDVRVEDMTAQWAGVSILEAGQGETLKKCAGVELPEAGHFVRSKDGVIFQGRRTRVPNWEWLYPVGADGQGLGLRDCGGTEFDFGAMERLRIESGIPAVPRDIGPEDLPNEGGLDRDAISYTKGCYLGQEVMARLRTMGQVRRQLLRVAGPVASPVILPAPLFVDGKKVGELRSAMGVKEGFVGLAMISLKGMTGRRLLSFSPDSSADIVINDGSA